ncbi:MAG: chromate transporter [Lachnospiraceae bacterium]|nr:chromate transporter [Lachnospiraceae bacterium]
MKKYLNLFLTMLKIGLFTFGGGYAMIALLENEFVSTKKWIKKDEFLDMVAIAESTPGPIAINAATYIGYTVLGFWGALTATVAVCIPSFTIIYIISLFFDAFLSLTLVAYAFKGIQVCVIYLIFTAGMKLLKKMEKNPFNISILIIVVAAMVLTSLFAVNFSTVYYILIFGATGIFDYLISLIRSRKEADR